MEKKTFIAPLSFHRSGESREGSFISFRYLIIILEYLSFRDSPSSGDTDIEDNKALSTYHRIFKLGTNFFFIMFLCSNPQSPL